jgi:formiminotetrahydrofolate cyclodeaminase
MEMQDMNVRELIELTASNAPAPGGGAIAALSGAFGAALAAMVGSLTLGKKGYEDAQEEMAEMTDKGKNLAKKLLAAMDKDANSFNGYMAALGMPKGTEEEKTIRRAAMQDALKSASLVPLNTAKTAAEVFPLAEAAVKSGNRNAVTDGLVAAMMARTAVLGALLNVKINLGSIKDEAFVQELQAACGALQEEAIAAEQRILDLVPELK